MKKICWGIKENGLLQDVDLANLNLATDAKMETIVVIKLI